MSIIVTSAYERVEVLPRAIREAQTSVLDITKGEDDISWKRIRSVRHLAAQTDRGSTFEHI